MLFVIIFMQFAQTMISKYQYKVNLESQKKDAEKVLDDAVNFVSRLKDINKTLSKDLVLAKLNKKVL